MKLWSKHRETAVSRSGLVERAALSPTVLEKDGKKNWVENSDCGVVGEWAYSFLNLDVLGGGWGARRKAGRHRRVRRSRKKQECDTLCTVDVPSFVTPDTKARGTLAWGERWADRGLRHR